MNDEDSEGLKPEEELPQCLNICIRVSLETDAGLDFASRVPHLAVTHAVGWVTSPATNSG